MKKWSALGAGSLLLGASAAYAGNGILINEIRTDHLSFDSDEYFELIGPPDASLDGLTYFVIGDGSTKLGSGVIESVVSLDGSSIGSDGFFLCADDKFGAILSGTPDLIVSVSDLFENSDNVTHMLVSGFTAKAGDDLDTDDDGVLDSTPWTEVIDSIAIVEEANPPSGTEFHYGPPSIGPDGTFVPGHVYRCAPDGTWTIGEFDAASLDANDTPGAANADCAPPEPDCDGDGIPDEDEIALGLDLDCNNNGIPDSCDLESGELTDENGNGMPDECEVLAPEGVQINEIRLEQPGAENDEYFELTGDGVTSLNGVYYIVIGGEDAGGSGVIECVLDLSGSSIAADGFFLAVEDTYSLTSILSVDLIVSTEFNTLNFEGFDNKTHVLVANFFGFRGQDLDTDDDGELDETPWLDELDRVAVIVEDNPPMETMDYHYGGPTVGPDGEFLPAHVYRCVPDGTWLVGAFDPADVAAVDTPAAVNPGGCPKGPPPCPADLTGDGTVGFADLLIVLDAWEEKGGPADLDGSGTVGFADLLLLLDAWGDCPKA